MTGGRHSGMIRGLPANCRGEFCQICRLVGRPRANDEYWQDSSFPGFRFRVSYPNHCNKRKIRCPIKLPALGRSRTRTASTWSIFRNHSPARTSRRYLAQLRPCRILPRPLRRRRLRARPRAPVAAGSRALQLANSQWSHQIGLELLKS
jgi:hypothetical protein